MLKILIAIKLKTKQQPIKQNKLIVRLAFTVEYDGTDFSGFQRQKNAPTIQEKIEDAIRAVTESDISINYSGRTDAGVHALSQVFDFETNIKRDEKIG